MKPEKMKSLSEAKVRLCFPKKYKVFSVFLAILWFYLQFHCKIYAWRWCESNLIFFLVISVTLSFQVKKFKFQKFCFHGFLWPLSVDKIFKILQLVWTLTPNKFWPKCLRYLIFAQTIVSQPYFGNNYFNIHMIAISR